jgi:hypothetical protein
MVEWLQQTLRKPKLSVPTLFGIGAAIPWLALGAVAVFSDIGFAEEVKANRWRIISGSLLLGLVGVAAYVYWFLCYRVRTLQSEIGKLQRDNQDLNDQKESVFRLMKRYEAEAQESIFERLEALALSSIMHAEWKKKGARVERARVEKASKGDEDLQSLDSLYRVTVFINLGQQDSVFSGMRFFVQDPTDLRNYGTIVINECHAEGSSCSIVHMDHQGFWADVLEALQSPDESPIIQAPPNILVSTSPFKELSEESAAELIDWLLKLKRVKL